MRQLTIDLLPLVLMAGIMIATLAIFWKLLDVVVLSVSAAVVLYPLHRYCSRSVNRYISAGIITVLLFVVFISVVLASVSIVSSNSGILKEDVSAIQDWVDASSGSSVFGLPIDREQVAAGFQKAEDLVSGYWNAILSEPVLIAFKIFVFFTSFSVFLLHGAAIYDRILTRVPAPLKGHVSTMSSVTVDTLYAIYVVHAGISALTFVIAIPFFIFLGYGNVLFYSFLCGFCELIPVLGSSAVFIFLGVLALATGDIRSLLFIIVFGYIGVAALPEIYIRPVFMGRRVRIHPFVMFIGFIGGILTLGMAGFVLGPVVIVLLFTGYSILLEEKKSHKRTGLRQTSGSGE